MYTIIVEQLNIYDKVMEAIYSTALCLEAPFIHVADASKIEQLFSAPRYTN